MIHLDEDALTCDFAETYHVLNMRGLSPRLAATLAIGLHEDSRIKKAIGNRHLTLQEYLIAGIFDKVNLILWSKTKDAQKGVNRPKSVLEILENPVKESKYQAFNTIEDFEKRRAEILGA